LEKVRWLLSPDADAYVVDEVLQKSDGRLVEAAAEVARGGGIREPTSTQSIEENLVLAAVLQILQTGAVAEDVVREREDVIGFVVREMELEQMQTVVNGINETHLPRQGMHGTDPAGGQATGSVSDLIVNITGGEHGPVAPFQVSLVQAAFDPALAASQLLAYLGFHLKSLGL
jgi:hypothetical protein